ncbi:MAG: hypothetical protein JXR96_10590, partial [Deltaproteobacteria bacterium]|nr:hypothetical protein [Deltaproteobacteria bacterium]
MPIRTLLHTLLLALLASGCVGQDTGRPSADDLQVIADNVLREAPGKMRFAVGARLEDRLTYLGLDTDKASVRPGGRLELTHYWQVLRPVTGWKVFVHLNDPSQQRFINADHVPIGGRYPAGMWKPGEIVRDTHSVSVPPDWSAPEIVIYAGLWRGDERMEVEGPQDEHSRILAARIPVSARPKARPRPRRLLVKRSTGPVELDGRPDEQAWKKAPSTGRFVHTMTGAPAAQRTHLRALWDDDFLYLAFEMEDRDVWSELDGRDAELWKQEAVEVFLDADRDGRDYVELQVGPRGNLFDAYLPAPRANQNDWNSGARAEVSIAGSLNKRDDADQGWSVELAIPWKDCGGRKQPAVARPSIGDVWHANFFRLDQPADGPQQAAAWSPPRRADFHALDRFGELVFADAQGRIAPRDAAKTDAAKTDAAKTGAAKTGAAKTDAAKTGAAKTDAAKTGATKTDATKTGAAKTGAAKTDAAKTGAAKTGAAKTGAAKTGAAKT